MRDEAKDRSTMSEDDDDDTINPTTNHHKWAPNLSSAGGSTKLRPEPGLGPIRTDSPPPFSDQILEIVLENVLQFLTSRFDRNSASLVCKSWYRAEAQARHELFIGNCYAVAPRRAVERFRRVVSVVLKGKPRFADFNLVPFDWGAHVGPWISAFAQGYRWLEKLCVKRMSITDSDLKVIALSMPNFKELVIICSDGFGTEGIAAIAENCKQLRVLNLIDDYLEDDEEQKADWVSMFPQTVTCLETLVFECVGCAVNFDELEALVARSPKLQQLRVNQPVSAEQLRRLMVRAPQLTQLGTGSFRSVAAGEGIDNELNGLVSAFAASKKIVSLSGFRDLSLELLPAIFPVCANLTSLNFSFCEITSEQLRPVIVHCHNLQKFWALDTVHDEGLQMVAATCKDLRELRVFPLDPREDSNGAVSNIGLTAIAEGCLKLRSILYFCQQMTNAAVITMSMNCKDLQVFRLCIMGRHRPDHVTGEPMDEGFGAIVINCKRLTRLAVSGLLTDKAFCYIGKYGKLVRTLSVAFAGNSDLALTYVLQGCHKLQKLEIRDSPFGDSSLLSGIHHYYNMRFLWMSACQLTLRGCKEVAQRLPRMVLEAISDEGEVVDGDDEVVEKLYMYRSLDGPRNDAPPYVKIL